MMLESKTHGYPDSLSMQVQFKTEPPHTFELSEYDNRSNKISIKFNWEILLDVQDSDDFYLNVSFKQLL